eukprot:6179270-Pleurochrysis_carterae.AAC.1
MLMLGCMPTCACARACACACACACVRVRVRARVFRARVRALEDVGAALGGGADELGRVDLGETLAEQELTKQLHTWRTARAMRIVTKQLHM